MINDNELPFVSLCLPIWNRNNFKQLILMNLMSLQYPREKIELCIDDDGDTKFLINKEEENAFRQLIKPIKLKYFYRNHRRTIGAKRNNLTKIATHKIIACMDSDDLYLPTYLVYAVNELKRQKVSCVGSNQMLFVYPYHNWSTHAIRCSSKRQIHEACLVYTKKHHNSMGGFISSSQGEGSKMADYNEKNVGLMDIDECMVCIVHNENTIPKDMFMKEENKIDITFNEQVKQTIAGCLNINLTD